MPATRPHEPSRIEEEIERAAREAFRELGGAGFGVYKAH
jgi:hypothetical protein